MAREPNIPKNTVSNIGNRPPCQRKAKKKKKPQNFITNKYGTPLLSEIFTIGARKEKKKEHIYTQHSAVILNMNVCSL